MSYHIIDISTNNVSLTAKDGQLVCRSPDDTVRKLPMEDIGAVLVNSFSVQLHSSFLIEAAKRRVAVIVCERFRPVSLVLPVQRVTDTILTRVQIQAPARLMRRMWESTVNAKCANQYEFVSRICSGDERRLSDFRIIMNGSSVSKEGNCVRMVGQGDFHHSCTMGTSVFYYGKACKGGVSRKDTNTASVLVGRCWRFADIEN